jgi:hypothetical protein
MKLKAERFRDRAAFGAALEDSHPDGPPTAPVPVALPSVAAVSAPLNLDGATQAGEREAARVSGDQVKLDLGARLWANASWIAFGQLLSAWAIELSQGGERSLPCESKLKKTDQGARVSEQVRAELPSHRHANTVGTCTFHTVVWPEFLFGDLEASERHSAELVAYCAERKVEQIRLAGALCHACARAMRKPTVENVAAIRAAIDAYHRSGARIYDSVFISQLVEALLTAGDVTGAEAALQEGFIFVEQSGERFWLAELHRVGGRIALNRPEPDRARAEACFLQAIEIARGQEARLLELRTATDLARLWRDAGSPKDPRALLEPILAAIEGGETTRDVRNARALLAELV